MTEGEDRLSSLPDEILINTLSNLPLTYAAQTCVLSRRWRHLWTGVTCFNYYAEDYAVVIDILAKLTSPIFSVFYLMLGHVSDLGKPDVAESWFRRICSRRIEKIHIDAPSIYSVDGEILYPKYRDINSIHIPNCLFQTQSLVTLNLEGMLNFGLPANNTTVYFPNLKNLSLRWLVDVSPWLVTLLESCPNLKHLDLMFEFDDHQPPPSSLKVSAPNLEDLSLTIHSPYGSLITQIFIDAPNLINIDICDYTSGYFFVQNPTRLAVAFIKLRGDSRFGFYMGRSKRDEVYLRQMSEFIAALSNVGELELHLERESNLYNYLNSVNHGINLPVFRNLACLKTSLRDIGLIGWKDLLLSLVYFPNLEHLEVHMVANPPEEGPEMIWSAPDSVPDCLVCKLKTVKIRCLTGIHNELFLLAYILSNATKLEQLWVLANIDDDDEKGDYYSETQIRNDAEFCRSLFALPRGSTTCEILFED